MRFNDLIGTVLSGRAQGQWSAAILWRQCIDLLAQFDRADARDDVDIEPVVVALAGISGQLDTAQKLGALRELGGRLTSPRLVRLLARDDASVQVAAMNAARLDDAQWPAIIAEAGPLARSVLRNRGDLGEGARRALEAFGAADLSLLDLTIMADEEAGERDGRVTDATADAHAPAEHAPLDDEQVPARVAHAEGEGQSQILRIVDRIERFTSERQERSHREAGAAAVEGGQETGGEAEIADDPEAHAGEADVAPDPGIAHITFLTDAEGVIRTVHGAPPAALAGWRLAAPSPDCSVGPDGQILGAFRRRGAFREGRLTIGAGVLAGCWLVDGDPLFDQRSGRFTGYRGIARRAARQDIAPFRANSVEADITTSTSTSLRQLIHELRSPLSGVMGFAELIENQFLGPVDDSYRSMAGNIVADVRNLVDILDDLDLANRRDRLAVPADKGHVDVAPLLADAVERLGRDGAGRARISLHMESDLPGTDVARTVVDRMIVHFVRALTGCVGTETLAAQCHRDGDRLLVEIERPLAMADLSDAQLFDSGFEHVAVNMDAPVLGVGFALRLVRRLAQANNGAFTVHPGHFTLVLPVPVPAVEQGLSS